MKRAPVLHFHRLVTFGFEMKLDSTCAVRAALECIFDSLMSKPTAIQLGKNSSIVAFLTEAVPKPPQLEPDRLPPRR